MKTLFTFATKFSALAMIMSLAGCLGGGSDSSITGPGPDNSGNNSAPSISGTPPGSVTVGATYSFTPGASDPDGDSLTFSIENKPTWAQFETTTGSLSGVPTLGDIGAYTNIRISVSDGQLSTSMSTFTVDVDPGNGTNSPPTISGNPAITVAVGQAYSFTPLAFDPDGDSLTFSIQNQPSWASFNTSSGQLSGVPSAGDVGTYANIQISVSDGRLSTSLPSFSIEVTPGAGSNSPPTITGTPPPSVVADVAYSFTPSASDPDGDSLTFSIENQPGWASFDTDNGQLSGVPTVGDIGVYADIRISVSDGEFTASLPDFDVEVTAVGALSTTLTWIAPTLNEDGTELTDLAGFIIFYGTSSGNYTTEIPINNPSVTSYLVENLSPGTYYFAAKAVNSTNEESQFSGELTRMLE